MKLVSLIFILFVMPLVADQTTNLKKQTVADQTAPATGCTNLTQPEMIFASSLSAVHYCVFCSCFGPQQRAQAIAYTSSNQMNKTTGMTYDMAVELTLKNCRGMTAAPVNPIPTPQEVQAPANPAPTGKKRSPCVKSS